MHRKIQEILGKHFGVEAEKVTDSSTLEGDLGADSLDYVEICIDLEDAFDCVIPEHELFACRTAGEVSNLVALQCGQAVLPAAGGVGEDA